MADESRALSADKPIRDPKDDRLGYEPFARHLASSLCTMAPAEGFVVAIHGPWGSGKTTVLNFIKHYLAQESEEERPVVIEFNPWWFSGREDLTRHLFGQMQAILAKQKVLQKKICKQMANLADAVSVVTGSSRAQALAKILRREKNLNELKGSISTALAKQSKRILVIIDDIDRLAAAEIRHLFRVIKAVADFPKVTYLLAFDRMAVIEGLKGVQGPAGEAYLEKIVQASFTLPMPDKTSLGVLLFEKMDAILAGTDAVLVDQSRWDALYRGHMVRFIRTPRDVVRLTNALRVTYAAVKGEVNVPDFVAIETLRLFSPRVYDIVRSDADSFTGILSFSDPGGHSHQKLQRLHNSWIESLENQDREPIKQFLQLLFPKLREVWSNYAFPPDSLPSWRSLRRICLPEIFPVYFRLAVPKGEVSNQELEAVLALVPDLEAFAKKIVEIRFQTRPDGTSRVFPFLQRLWDKAEDLLPDVALRIAKVLLAIGDYLRRQPGEPRAHFFGSTAGLVGGLVRALLGRLDPGERFAVLKCALQKPTSLTTIVWLLTMLGEEHGKYGQNQPELEGRRLLTKDELQTLEGLAIERVRAVVRNAEFLKSPEPTLLLDRWRDWGSLEEVGAWCQCASSDPQLREDVRGWVQRFLKVHAASPGESDPAKPDSPAGE